MMEEERADTNDRNPTKRRILDLGKGRKKTKGTPFK
jgi:hypothetical protein